MAIAETLVRLSRADWKYADLYLRDAEVVLERECTRLRFNSLAGGRNRIGTLASDLQQAIRLGDWAKTESLANEGTRLRRYLDENSHVHSIAKEIYGTRSLQSSPTVLGLSGAVAQPAKALSEAISRVCRDLRSVASSVDVQRGFYQIRAEHFERIIVDPPEERRGHFDPSRLREMALAAIGRSDFAAVLEIARRAAQGGADPLGRIRAPRPTLGCVEHLAQPLPTDAIRRARELGFESAELQSISPLNAYLSCSCADRAVLAPRDGIERQRGANAATCGHPCPPEIRTALKETLDSLMGRPALTSAGTRYLPWFGAETVLVEAFSEEERDARTPLLEALSLPRRLGLARLTIENALLSRGPDVCEDLGLDPVGYQITCIPFDAYQRLANQRCWGKQRLWTHFDGYHITRDLKLLALVGGDIQRGGADELCAVGRSYDSDRITARFAVVRRDRFGAREFRSES